MALIIAVWSSLIGRAAPSGAEPIIPASETLTETTTGLALTETTTGLELTET